MTQLTMAAASTKPAFLKLKLSEAKCENVWIIENLELATRNKKYLDQLKQEIEIGEGSSMHSKWVLSLECTHSLREVHLLLHCKLAKIISDDISELLHCQFSANCENFAGRVGYLEDDKEHINENDHLVVGLGSVRHRLLGDFGEMKISFKLRVFSTADPDARLLEEEFRTRCVTAAQINLASIVVGDRRRAFDVILVCRDGKELKCHKNMLKANSPVFQAMMDSGLSETQTGQINIADISGEIMEILLLYMYTGKLKETWRQSNVVVEFIYAVAKYEITVVIEYLNNTLGTIYHVEWDSTTLDALADLTGKLSWKNTEARLKKRIVQRALSADNFSDVVSVFESNK